MNRENFKEILDKIEEHGIEYYLENVNLNEIPDEGFKVWVQTTKQCVNLFIEEIQERSAT